MIRIAPAAAAALLLFSTPAHSQEAAAPATASGAPQPLVQQLEPVPPPAAQAPIPATPAPTNPAQPEVAPPAVVAAPVTPPPVAVPPVAQPVPAPQPAAAAPALPAAPPVAQPAAPPVPGAMEAPPPPPAPPSGLPAWASALLLVVGAAMAGSIGLMVAGTLHRRERAERRRAVAAALALELGARIQAFEAVPVPPNAEAGVSFVSLVLAVAGLDHAFRAGQDSLHLLPGKLALQVMQHYAAVQRISTFVKGQSLAAAVRMLQANRIGGHPCPDAGTMRDSHVDLANAFHGLERLVEALARLG